MRYGIVAIFFSFVLFYPTAITGQSGHFKPETVLEKARDRYRSYSSYQDVGEVITTYNESTGRRIDKQPFKLYFSRPNRFRIEWQDYDLKNQNKRVLWSDGRDTYTYWEPDRYVRKDSLDLGIAGATGISGGAAATIPHLLMPETGISLIHDLSNLRLLGMESFENEPCYRIRGSDSDGDPVEVWISERDFLVRKVRTNASFEDFSTVQEEVHRDITINRPIAQDIFNFEPPIPLKNKTPKEGEVLYAPVSNSWVPRASFTKWILLGLGLTGGSILVTVILLKRLTP